MLRGYWLLTAGTFTALLTTAGCLAVENRLLYHPTHSAEDRLPPASPLLQDVELHTADGTAIHARWRPHPASRGALLYCHGNAGNLEQRGWAVRELGEALGKSVLIFDYPGYGRSGGEPSEAGCYAAADAAYEWLVRDCGVQAEDILLYGESLGGGVAVDLASRRPHRALILVRTFTSIPNVAQEQFGWLPIRRLVSSRFDNLAKIGRCERPIFIARGDRDPLVPFSQGKQLRDASGGKATFFTMEGCGHNDPPGVEFYAALRRFLLTAVPATGVARDERQ
jgi:fermentation-respiration switch protein FrsA (DUF1100 family)